MVTLLTTVLVNVTSFWREETDLLALRVPILKGCYLLFPKDILLTASFLLGFLNHGFRCCVTESLLWLSGGNLLFLLILYVVGVLR